MKCTVHASIFARHALSPGPCHLGQSLARKGRSTARIWISTASEAREKPWYGTTPIFYVNAAPHVGHLYSLVLTDILKRWNHLNGRQSLLCTGTDEHGMKVQRAAALANIEPKTFCDSGADVFRNLADAANISYTTFMRTTSGAHQDAVRHAWAMLQDQDLIYKSKHEGWYSVSDEAFYPQSAVHLTVDPPTGRKIMVSTETGKEVEWTSESNYKFRLSTFRERLLQFYRDNPTFILPATRRDEIVQQVTDGLEDLSISRPSSRLTWGVSVPGDESQTLYVWLDALLNYATASGYPWTPGKEHAGGWPADLHVIGKDITRFHCIYWPAFLMGLHAPLPKQILAHAHWTLGKEKMAKSTGNVVNPFFAMERFGVDTMRFYLAHDGGIQDDSDYGNEQIAERYRKALKGGLGNLTSRITRGKGWNVRQAVQRAISGESHLDPAMTKHRDFLQEAIGRVHGAFENLNVSRAVKEIMDIIYQTNAFLSLVEPWKLSKVESQDAKSKVDYCIFLCAESIRISGILLQPFIPSKAATLLDMLGVEPTHRSASFASLGADSTYGIATVELGRGRSSVLFPELLVED